MEALGRFGKARPNVAATLKEGDCFGAILKSGGGVFTFVSGESGKPYATLDRDGLHIQRGSGKGKEKNTVPLRALKTLLREVERIQE
jgi:hypothetical protein